MRVGHSDSNGFVVSGNDLQIEETVADVQAVDIEADSLVVRSSGYDGTITLDGVEYRDVVSLRLEKNWDEGSPWRLHLEQVVRGKKKEPA
jgi:hypothetical protein